MTTLRTYLATELAKKVERSSVVIWDDPERAFSDVVAEVAPSKCTLHVFDGSWFALRRSVEPLLAGTTPPVLLVYVGANAPDPDPLEELRSVGSRYRITLPTLIKNALAGQLSDQRISQIGKQSATIGGAEAAIQGADSATDARLIAMFGESSERAIASHLLAGTNAEELEARALTDVVRSMLAGSLGGDFTNLAGDQLRVAAFQQAVLSIIYSAVGDVPDDLRASFSVPTAQQRKTARAVLETLQVDRSLRTAYVALASALDERLGLATRIPWDGGLTAVDVTAGIESVARGEGVRRLQIGDYPGTLALGMERLASSWWVHPEAPNGSARAAQWRAITALAELGQSVGRPLPSLSSLREVVEWYVRDGYLADSAFRRSENVRVSSGAALEEFDDLYHEAREAYETWLDKVLHRAAEALADVDIPATDLQRSIHDRHVRGSTGRCAYVLVDALRYELGRDLADRLASVNAEIRIAAAVGTAPTITPVGMAAVLPGAATAFEIGLTDEHHLEVTVAGERISTVADRVRRLTHEHGTVVDLELDKLAQLTNKDLKRRIEKADLVLVRSTEIDAGGESDQLAASWGSFDATLSVLHTAVAKLLHAGVQRIVITADHGFLAVRQLGEHRRIDKPATGIGEQHRRAWIGRGGTAGGSTIKLPLAAFGIGGDLEIITPRGLGVFLGGGGLQFFHGGLSPQELTVPVVTVVGVEASPEPKYQIRLEVAGDRITTGVIAVKIAMAGDLFTRESRVRVQLVSEGRRVAAVVGGDGYDAATGTVDASVDSQRVITMQVTGTILSGAAATLEVLDAATGVRLAAREIEVAADVIVEASLD